MMLPLLVFQAAKLTRLRSSQARLEEEEVGSAWKFPNIRCPIIDPSSRALVIRTSAKRTANLHKQPLGGWVLKVFLFDIFLHQRSMAELATVGN